MFEKVKSKIMSSKWTPRVMGAVTALSVAGAGVVASAEDAAPATIDYSELATTLQNSAMTGITNGYKFAIPVMAVSLTVGLIVRKIMGAARRS